MKSIPCNRCDARCCRTYVVPLNGADIRRLSEHLRTPIHEWCVLEPLSEPIREYAYFSIRLKGEERFIPCLKRENGACTFLRRSNPRAACGIHDARPGMCRSYPITFCSGKAEHTDGCICPERWELDVGEDILFHNLYIQYNSSFADFKETTDLWERSRRQEHILTGRMSGDTAVDARIFLDFLSHRHCTR